jgi:membrane protein implicated in regulation of membrane protease activity
MDWMKDLDPHWAWLGIGLVLAAAEMAIPGVFLIWMAGAAIITGVIAWQLDISVPLQIVIFAVLSIVSVTLGRRYLRSHPVEGADPLLNRRGAQLVGQTGVVTAAIDGGTGRVRHGDSEWLASGPDIEVGARVRITGTNGSTLLVERVAPPAAETLSAPKEA